MRELVINLHGIGVPHDAVGADEKRYWWSSEALARLLDRVAAVPAAANPRISLTFDDGNASDAVLVLPQLHKRGLAASFFVCAGRIGNPHYLDRSMIRDLLDAGMTVGSHGMDHVDWCSLSAAGLDVEIGDARRKLEDVAQREVTTVGIPFGSYNRRVLGRLKRERLECIYTSDRGMARTTARIKPRETLLAEMQDRDILRDLAEHPPWVRVRRSLSRLYKRIS
jgi:peptidoglycan/xylan/chitin deacetylase (PgdA/CDA1 family)